MPSFFQPTIVTITIDGTPTTAHLLSLQSTLGSQPAEAVLYLPELNLEDVAAANANFKGKPLLIDFGSTRVLTGHVYRVTKRKSNRGVTLVGLDNRWKMNRLYVGCLHLDGTLPALPQLGADIVFNAEGKPNKSQGGLEFVGVGGANNYSNADYWTYGQIIEWLWVNYVPDVTLPALVSGGGLGIDGGLGLQADELNLFGMPVAEALDEVFSRTRAAWYVDGPGVAHVFSLETPVATFAMSLPNPDVPRSPGEYELDEPSELIVEDEIDDALAQVDLIGGRMIKEVTFLDTDWVTEPDYFLSPQPDWIKNNFTGNTWSNYNVGSWFPGLGQVQQGIKRHTLKSTVWASLGVGPNLQADERPYRLLGHLLVGKDKNGKFVAPDSNEMRSMVTMSEQLAPQYPFGPTWDPDSGSLVARYVTYPAVGGRLISPPNWSIQPPQHMTSAVECAYRKYVSATGSVTGAPATLRRAVVRNEFVHMTRMATAIHYPVIVTIDVGALSYVVAPAYVLPTGWTALWTTPNGLPINPPDFFATIPEGVVVDGEAPLTEIKNMVETHVGKTVVNGRGEFPSFRTLEPGTLITVGTNAYGLTDEELVVAVSFNGNTQKLEFAFTNRLGNDVLRLAQQFIDTRRYRRPL